MNDTARHLVEQAHAMRREGDRLASLWLYRQAQIAFGEDDSGRAHCLRHIGDLERELGHPDEARQALQEAEAFYRGSVRDILSLANTVRLLALIDGEPSTWRKARALYEQAGRETGLDMAPAFAECDLRLAGQ